LTDSVNKQDVNVNHEDNDGSDTSTESIIITNPLVQRLKWHNELYRRIKLLPWWIKYNIGLAEAAVLKRSILKLASDIGFQDRWTAALLRHAVSEFSKKGLGADYYGYHNIQHELEAAYFSLIAAYGHHRREFIFDQQDLIYLFVAALFHDYDPLKHFDKPHEDSVEAFVRDDKQIKKYLDDVGINIDIVFVLIQRTAYPFRDKIAEHASMRIEELFTLAGIPESDSETREHYKYLGWFLSVSERIAGYALGDIEHGRDLARRNAHALGWHPSRINEESVRYFSIMKEEKEMMKSVLEYVPEKYKKNFFDNIQSFKDAWEEENSIRASIRKNETNLVPVSIEKCDSRIDPSVRESVLNIYRELPLPVPAIYENKFKKSLSNSNTILITLRVNDKNGKIVGYVKGGPLETYELRRGTHDYNVGKKNTAYMEWIGIKSGYWGGAGGHALRSEFLKEARNRGYVYVTSYVHRLVITKRKERGEPIELVQKYDPDRLDYYRIDLKKLTDVTTITDQDPRVVETLPSDLGIG
jgi:hypothetical protein